MMLLKSIIVAINSFSCHSASSSMIICHNPKLFLRLWSDPQRQNCNLLFFMDGLSTVWSSPLQNEYSRGGGCSATDFQQTKTRRWTWTHNSTLQPRGRLAQQHLSFVLQRQVKRTQRKGVDFFIIKWRRWDFIYFAICLKSHTYNVRLKKAN